MRAIIIDAAAHVISEAYAETERAVCAAIDDVIGAEATLIAKLPTGDALFVASNLFTDNFFDIGADYYHGGNGFIIGILKEKPLLFKSAAVALDEVRANVRWIKRLGPKNFQEVPPEEGRGLGGGL